MPDRAFNAQDEQRPSARRSPSNPRVEPILKLLPVCEGERSLSQVLAQLGACAERPAEQAGPPPRRRRSHGSTSIGGPAAAEACDYWAALELCREALRLHEDPDVRATYQRLLATVGPM